MRRVFISYVSKDRKIAKAIAEAVWATNTLHLDPYDYDQEFKVGTHQVEQIREEVRNSGYIIFVISKHSLSQVESGFAVEANTAIEAKGWRNPAYKWCYSVCPDDFNLPIPVEWRPIVDQVPTPESRLQEIIKQILSNEKKFPDDSAQPQPPTFELEEFRKDLTIVGQQLQMSLRPPFESAGFVIALLGERRRDAIPQISDRIRSLPTDERTAEIEKKLNQRCPRECRLEPIALCFHKDAKGADTFSALSWDVLKRMSPEYGLIHTALSDLLPQFRGDSSSLWDELVAKKELQLDLSNNKTTLVHGLTFRPGSRDFFGLLVPVPALGADSVSDTIAYNTALRKLCGFLQRMFVENLSRKMRFAKTRQQVQNSCLDLALSISGSDWGCIKTGCISPHASAPSASAFVAAECVYHCPKFYDEGVNPTGDERIKQVIGKGADAFIEMSPEHEARSIYVALIRDLTPEGLTRLPSIPNQRNIVGAMVLQHVKQNFLEHNIDDFVSDLEQITRNYVARLVELAQEEVSRSVEALRLLKSQGKKLSIKKVVERSVNKAIQGDNDRPHWLLIEMDDATPSVLCATQIKRSEMQTAFESIVGINGTPDRHFEDTILFQACTSRNPLFIHGISDAGSSRQVRRRNNHIIASSAWFHQRFLEQRRQHIVKKRGTSHEKSAEFEHIGIDLGEYVAPYGQSAAGFSMCVMPLVFVNGTVVGALALFTRQQNDLSDENIDKLFLDDEDLNKTTRVMYQQRHSRAITEMLLEGSVIERVG